jgi:hypothetical protein
LTPAALVAADASEKTVRDGWNEPLCMDSQKHTEQIRFLLGHGSVPTKRHIGSKQKLQDAVNGRFEILVVKYVP